MSGLMPYETAVRLLFQNIPRPKTTKVLLPQALGRIIACNVEADHDIPPFNKSVMDGYAVHSRDAKTPPTTLRVVGEIAAGRWPDFELGPNQAASIMTGAPLPPGADSVVMVEQSEPWGDSQVILHAGAREGQNVAMKGSEVASGETVLECGELIGSAQIGVLAIFGKAEIEVIQAPTCAICSTGSEIIDVTETPKKGQIRNSNALMLAAQSQRLGLSPTVFPIADDDLDAIRSALENALDKSDLIVLTGGVSMGRHDHVPQAVKEAGAEIIFHKVAIKPGKPILFARLGEQLIFGLPGNPVSSFVTFELFVRPAVRKWMNHKELFLKSRSALLKRGLENRSQRAFYAPGRIIFEGERLLADPVRTKGSADLIAFSRASCLIHLPGQSGALAAGSSVKVLLME